MKESTRRQRRGLPIGDSGTVGGPFGFAGWLTLLLVVGMALRVAYVVEQPLSDPSFALPILDGEVYTDWARSLAGGGSGPSGAYYQAPFYPWVLAAFFSIFGERFSALYLAQHLLAVLSAAGIALLARAVAGPVAGLFSAGLFLLYPPTTFFASRPLGEILAFALLVVALILSRQSGRRRGMAAGIVVGLAALARPNLLLVPLAWGAGEFWNGRRDRAAWIVAGLLVVVFPVAARNHAASGHWVPISSNAGLTAFHGNGPGAQGVFFQPEGFSGSALHQRAEATRIARRETGEALDEVDADRWWGRRALETRLADPIGTVRLLAVRAGLTIDTHEHGLDYPPALDRNLFRTTLRFPKGSELGIVPLALLLGLSGAGVVLRGWRGSAGTQVWLAILASAAMPMLFYVSSRYRFPAVALLCVPAGVGAAALLGKVSLRTGARRIPALIVAGTLGVLSLAIPSGALRIEERANGLSNLAVAYVRQGDLESALVVAEQAIRLQPGSAPAQFNRASVLERSGRVLEAERGYRRALEINPALARAAANLGGLLLARDRPTDAATVLRTALEVRPDSDVCWNNLIVAQVHAGDTLAARRSIVEATANGVTLDPALVDTVHELDAPAIEGERP